MKTQKIIFRDVATDWSEGLPLGNGRFGTMAWLDNQGDLNFFFNHYDVLYRVLYPPELKGAMPEYPMPWQRDLMEKRALEAHADPSHPAHQNYNYSFWPSMSDQYGSVRTGVGTQVAGELRFHLGKDVLNGTHLTQLDIRHGVVEHQSQIGKITASIAWDQDIFHARCNAEVKAISLTIPDSRLIDHQPVFHKAEAENIYYFTDAFAPQAEDHTRYSPRRYVTMLKLSGITATNCEVSGNTVLLTLDETTHDWELYLTTVTDDAGENYPEHAINQLRLAEKFWPEREKVTIEHRQSFMEKSQVELPDAMLEKLWCLHLYNLDICSGANAVTSQQACGLSGLWIIKSPSQWGSSWYWDVNIQSSFFPVFTANHTEFGKIFAKALKSYVDSARKQAQILYQIDGIATDFPFPYSHCIWPWCAQFLWWQYCYTMDEKFLREEAYPLFRGITDFMEAYLRVDEVTGKLQIFPDVSPEQGPLGPNSTISLATWKFCFQFTLKSAKILRLDSEKQVVWQHLLTLFPDYPVTESGNSLLDSEWAAPDTYLAHSSVLMPIFPIGEFAGSFLDNAPQQELAWNSWHYAEKSGTLGTFCLWLAAAAARLNQGDEALRILYERGIAHLLRSNGFLAECTDRWLQDCLSACCPVYNPPMIEAGSWIVTTINEMLLQSFDDVIRVFPALPRGQKAQRNLVKRFDAQSNGEDLSLKPWLDVAFRNFLAQGAFSISARCIGGETQEIEITSLAGGNIKLLHGIPHSFTLRDQAGNSVPFTEKQQILEWETVMGKTYILKTDSPATTTTSVGQAADDLPPEVLTASGRHVSIGRTADTEFRRMLEGSMLDFIAGTTPVSKLTLYKFDFGGSQPKDYIRTIAKQYHSCGKIGLDFTRIKIDTNYTSGLGYGWRNSHHLQHFSHSGPDAIRCDGIGGKSPATFCFNMPAGQYQLFFVCGDQEIHSSTRIRTQNQQWYSGSQIPGRFGCGYLLFILNTDTVVELECDSPEQKNWMLNAIIINRIIS